MAHDQPKFAKLRDVCLETVLKITVTEGRGTEDDPITEVIYLYSQDGTLLHCNDPVRREGRAGSFKTTGGNLLFFHDGGLT